MNYPKGTVAMANSGADTAGSQFFIVYEDTTLPAELHDLGRGDRRPRGGREGGGAGVAGGRTDGEPAAPIGILSTTVYAGPGLTHPMRRGSGDRVEQ